MRAAGGADDDAGSSAAEFVSRAELEALERRIEWIEQGGHARIGPWGTATYSKAYDLHRQPNEQQRVTTLSASSEAPAYPSQMMARVDSGGENSVLLAHVLRILGGMPEACPGSTDPCPGSTEVCSGSTEACPGGTVRQGMHTVSYKGVLFADTHDGCYLSGTAPDITIVRQGCEVHASTALAVLVLQAKALDNHHRGKMWAFLSALLDASPGRPLAKGVLFNGSDLEFFQLHASSSSAGRVLLEYTPRVLTPGNDGAETAWRELWTFLFSGGSHISGVDQEESLYQQYGWAPPHLYASDSTVDSPLHLTRLIAGSNAVNVWEAQWAAGDVAVCKHYYCTERLSSYSRERHALNKIKEVRDDPGGCVWPRLLAENDGQHLLVTQPLAKQMAYMTDSALQQLFAGIRFLHEKAKLVYRDLEDKHLGLSDGNLCVFDLSTCVPLESGTASGYSGTVINASDDVLEALHRDGGKAVPVRRQQDVVALVKTVYALTHPHRRPAIHAAGDAAATLLAQAEDAADLAAAVGKVRGFWATEFDVSRPLGRTWQRLVDLAHVDTPALSDLPYESAMSELESKLRMHACAR